MLSNNIKSAPRSCLSDLINLLLLWLDKWLGILNETKNQLLVMESGAERMTNNNQ